MSDAAHPADARGPAKPRKPAGDSAIEPKKKAIDKSEPAISPKPKFRDKKTLKGKGAGSDAELAATHATAAGDEPKEPKDLTGPTGSKTDARAEAKQDSRHDLKSDAKHDSRDAGGEARVKSRHDPKADSKADSRGDADTPVPADSDDDVVVSSDAADANVAAAQAEAADLPELPELPDVAPDEDEKFHAMCAWLSAAALILAMVCPFYFAGPLLYWLRYRRRSHFVAFHAKQALWWSFLATGLIWVVGLASGLVLGSVFGLEFVGLNLIALVPVQVTIIIWFSWIGLKALHGVKYRTPIIGRFAETAPQKWV